MSSTSYRNKNCGNIMVDPNQPWEKTYASRTGAIGKDKNNYAIYPTVIRGLAAMVRLLAGNYAHLTLLDAVRKYAPKAHGNRPEEYAGYVSHRAGVSMDMVLADMDPFQILRVVEAMIRFEGWAK